MAQSYGATVALVLQALAEFGPMTCAEISEHIGLGRYNVSSVISRLRRSSKRSAQRVYVQSYSRVLEGQRRYPRPVLALGALPDATPPRPLSRKEIRRKSDAASRKRNTMNFVFNMGVPRREFVVKARPSRAAATATLISAAFRPIQE